MNKIRRCEKLCQGNSIVYVRVMYCQDNDVN